MNFQLKLDTERIDCAEPAKPLCVTPDTSIRSVFEQLKANDKGSCLICEDGVLTGIFTERDVIKLMADDADLDVAIETVMVANPTTLSKEDTMGEAIKKMSSGGYRRLPVVDDNHRPVGMIKVSNILHYLVDHFPEVIYNLPPEPHHTTQQREGA